LNTTDWRCPGEVSESLNRSRGIVPRGGIEEYVESTTPIPALRLEDPVDGSEAET